VPFQLSKQGNPIPTRLRSAILTALLCYAYFPQIFSKPVGLEGFEIAVTNVVNYLNFQDFSTSTLKYNFENRPGEYLTYDFFSSLFSLDSLLIGQLIGTLCYTGSLVLTILISRKLKIADTFSVAAMFLLQFDLIATASIVSSVNLVLFLFLLTVFLYLKSRWIYLISACFSFSFAIFCRSDVIFLFPLFLIIDMLKNFRAHLILFRFLLIMSLSILSSAFLYSLFSIDFLDVYLLNSSGWSLSFPAYSISQIVSVLLPFNLILLILGVYIHLKGIGIKSTLLVFMFSITPITLMILIYGSRMDTPRFLVVGIPFLAIQSAVGLKYLIDNTKRVRTISLVIAFLIVLISFNAKVPNPTNDGFRYKYASYLTPAKIWEIKQEKVSAFEKLSRAVQAIGFQGEQKKISLISTSWLEYNNLTKSFIDLGANFKATYSVSLAGSPSFQVFTWRLGNSNIDIMLFERTREFLSPEAVVQAALEINSDTEVYILTASVDISQNVLTLCPQSEGLVVGTNSIEQPSWRYTTWIKFQGQCYKTIEPIEFTGWEKKADWAMLGNDVWFTNSTQKELLFSGTGCAILKLFKHQTSGSVSIFRDGKLLQFQSLRADSQINPFIIEVSTNTNFHQFRIVANPSDQQYASGGEVWIDSLLLDPICKVNK
jgi:hypothetical protein